MNRRGYQMEIIRREGSVGFMLLFWARQKGKSTTMAEIALKQMLEVPGRLFTFASASLVVGGEIIQKESQVLRLAFEEMRHRAEAAKLKLTTADTETGKAHAKDLKAEDFLDLYEAKRLEFRLYHSQTTYSRTMIIAPNPATARGFSGSVGIDEIGFIPDFRELWEAMEPIASSQQDFRVIMATTPPNDDKHFSYELLVPPESQPFPVNPLGNWYTSQAGVLVHRLDAYDAYAAGVAVYDINTRQPLTPDEHRKRHLDKRAWDINYGLKLVTGGTSACSLAGIEYAQTLGAGKCVAFNLDDGDDQLPQALVALSNVLGDGPLGMGYDVSTTEKSYSNPSSLTVLERIPSGENMARLILRWRTQDPNRSREIVRRVVETCNTRPSGGKVRRLAVDATNERFFATDLRTHLGFLVYVELVVSSEKTTYGGEDITVKSYLGTQLVNDLDEDHTLGLPPGKWIKDDWRLVMRKKGSFDNEVDSNGNHGDTFDSTKLARHAIGQAFSGGIESTDGIIVGSPAFLPPTWVPPTLGNRMEFTHA